MNLSPLLPVFADIAQSAIAYYPLPVSRTLHKRLSSITLSHFADFAQLSIAYYPPQICEANWFLRTILPRFRSADSCFAQFSPNSMLFVIGGEMDLIFNWLHAV